MSEGRKHAHLTEEELAEFQEIFNLVDLDKGGTISKDELKQLMNTLGLKPTQEELNQMVDEIDADGNGEIDFDEFVTVMSRKVNTSYTPTQVKAAFKVFERDCPQGYVSMSALEQALTTYGTEKLSLTDAQELLSQIEPDENGLINYVECAPPPPPPPPQLLPHNSAHRRALHTPLARAQVCQHDDAELREGESGDPVPRS